MFPRKTLTFQRRTLLILLICFSLVVVVNYAYFQSLTSAEKEIKEVKVNAVSSPASPNLLLASRIENNYWAKLSFNWSKKEKNSKNVDISKTAYTNNKLLPLVTAWKLAKSWVQSRQIFPKQSADVNNVLQALKRAPIINCDVGFGGTQLKIMLYLKGGQRAVFKPMRYARDKVFLDNVYSGADRHNGEIAAFHLSRLLDFRWAPLVVGRKLNIKNEIKDIAKLKLRRTFFEEGNKTCFYGECFYCNINDAVCSSNDFLEGSVSLWLPRHVRLKALRHPWSRTYKSEIKAPWETNDNYCSKVKKNPIYQNEDRLLDLIDVAVFDFLIGNGDRHRYEVFDNFNNSMVLLVDNGKSFGNPDKDEITILAPLYQCCLIRASTVEKLKSFSGRSLSELLELSLSKDLLYPILTEPHLIAIDRRRIKILEVVKFCLETCNGKLAL